LGIRFGSLESKIGSLESEKITIGSLESEKIIIGSLELEKSGPYRSIPIKYLTFSLKKTDNILLYSFISIMKNIKTFR